MDSNEGLPGPRQRPEPVEDSQNRVRKEQAIAPRAIRDQENSCIDKVPRGGVDAGESAADRATGVLNGEGRLRQRKRRKFVDHQDEADG